MTVNRPDARNALTTAMYFGIKLACDRVNADPDLHGLVLTDLRIGRLFDLTERFKLEGTVDMFNLINKFNVADVNILWSNAGQPTAAFDPRQFQFGLKLTF